MPVTVETGATLAFDRFWRWLKRHPNCILRAGTPDAYLYDADDLHWHLDEEEDRTPTVQLQRGKLLLGEIVIEAAEVLFVQALPDPDGDQLPHALVAVDLAGHEERGADAAPHHDPVRALHHGGDVAAVDPHGREALDHARHPLAVHGDLERGPPPQEAPHAPAQREERE